MSAFFVPNDGRGIHATATNRYSLKHNLPLTSKTPFLLLFNPLNPPLPPLPRCATAHHARIDKGCPAHYQNPGSVARCTHPRPPLAPPHAPSLANQRGKGRARTTEVEAATGSILSS